MTIAIEVLAEDGLEILQRGAFSRHRAACDISGEVTVAVDTPHRVLVGAGLLPGNVVTTAGELHRANHGPRPGCHGCAKLLQLGAQRVAAGNIEEVIVARLNERGGSVD